MSSDWFKTIFSDFKKSLEKLQESHRVFKKNVFKSSEVFFPSMQLIQCSYNQLFVRSVTLVTLLALMCLQQQHPITACLVPFSINSSTLLSCAG